MTQARDISLSLSPDTKLKPIQMMGMLCIAGGLLSLLVAFAGKTSLFSVVCLGIGCFVSGAIVLAQQKGSFKSKASLLFAAGILLLLCFYFFSTAFDLEILGFLFLILLPIGIVGFFTSKFLARPPGIQNNGIYQLDLTRPLGPTAWLLGLVMTGFYVLLYWFPHTLHGLIAATDFVYQWFFPGKTTLTLQADGSYAYNQWFMYGLFYTIAVLAMGIRFIIKYRHVRYQVIRTLSVMFFQLVAAFLLPNILEQLNSTQHGDFAIKTHYFSYFWPLDYDALFPDNLSNLWASGGFGKFIFWWGLFGSFIAVPVLTYFYGKRWYCSWVCGCGGLAETAGDPFRQLSDKSLKAWKLERILIHSVLAFIILVTILLLLLNPMKNAFGFSIPPEGFIYTLKGWYGFFVGSIFAGVIGTGFYPILGSRVWCRFGCPQAAILGIFQKYFSRFRITTNGSQCISCGNCSTYCEMGIDVKWYAQRGQDIVRASCVGCGVCSAVCPRGVLKLENGPASKKNL